MSVKIAQFMADRHGQTVINLSDYDDNDRELCSISLTSRVADCCEFENDGVLED